MIDTTAPSIVYQEPSACLYTGTGFNPCRAAGAPFDQQVTLKGSGVPYLMDTESGEVTPIAQYSTGPGTVTVRVSLARDESTIIALAAPNRFGPTPLLHVVSTTADSVALADGKLVVRDTQPGMYRVTLSNGATKMVRIGDVPAAVDLTGATWQLAAEDWKPANPLGTTGQAGSAVTKDPVNLTLSGLKAWPEIPELTRASGVGTYTTSVSMPSKYDAESSVILSLGKVVDTVHVQVNGHDVAVDQISARAEIGPHLEPGANTIVVRVATTLNNRLSTLFPAVATRGVIQNYGLVGPVTLTPSGQATVLGRAFAP